MIEHRMPIPARAYNAAVGGHVCGPEDVDFGQKVVHLVKYDRAGNEVSFESQVTQANKVYVIHDDFTLSSNVTIPANCVLEFDGGSISGAHTITGQNTDIEGDLCKLFGDTINFAGTFNTLKLEWFGIIGNNQSNAELFRNLKNRITVSTLQNFEFCSDITFAEKDIILPQYFELNGNGNKLIFTGTSGEACIIASTRNTLSNITFYVDADYEGAVLENDTSKRDGHYWVCQLRLHNINIFGRYNVEDNYKATAIRYKCTNNHPLGNDGYNYITTNYSDTLIIQWVKNGIEIVLDNVDGNPYAWMNDFYFGYTFIQCSGTAVKIDNRDNSTSNPPDSSGLACFGDLYIQPCIAGNTQLIMLYKANVDIKNFWPWDVQTVGELRNNSNLCVHYCGIGFVNIPSITENNETCKKLCGFKIYDTSEIQHNELYNEPIKWDNYNPLSGIQTTKIKAKENSIQLFHNGEHGVPISIINSPSIKGQKWSMLKIKALSSSDIGSAIIQNNNQLTVLGNYLSSGGVSSNRIIYNWIPTKVLVDDKNYISIAGEGFGNSRSIRFTTLASANLSKNSIYKLSITLYSDTEKTSYFIGSGGVLTPSLIYGIFSSNKNIDVLDIEVNNNSFDVYCLIKEVGSNFVGGFYCKFDENITYTTDANGNSIPSSEFTDMPNSVSAVYTKLYSLNGTTRPTPSDFNNQIGFCFFDENLSPARPIWWNGSAWVDSTGTTV